MNKRLLSFLLIGAVIATAAILWKNPKVSVIRMDDCTGIGDLAYNGKEVTLEGAWNLGFETNVIFPRRLLHNGSGPREPVLWVNLADDGDFSELWDRLKAWSGDVRVHGVLNVSAERGFGHMGMCDGEINNAVVTFRPARALFFLTLLLLFGSLMLFACRSRRRRQIAG